MLTQYFPQLMDWINQAANFELNRRILRLNYQNIAVVLHGKVITDHAYNFQIDLYS